MFLSLNIQISHLFIYLVGMCVLTYILAIVCVEVRGRPVGANSLPREGPGGQTWAIRPHSMEPLPAASSHGFSPNSYNSWRLSKWLGCSTS